MSSSSPLPHDDTEADLAETLAAEYLARTSAGEELDLELFVEERAGPELRARVIDLAHLGLGTTALLPRPVGPGLSLNGRYRVERLIGEGGMSRVYLARDESLGRRVAIKVTHSIGRDEVLRQEALRQEMRALSALDHPNIVPLYDTGVDGEIAYLVTRYVEGQPLAAVLERARELLEREHGVGAMPRGAALWERALDLGPPQGKPSLLDGRDWCRVAARIALELARTLEAAHARGVVHRDLKPSNVVLEAGGHPVVLDFGLAGCADGVGGSASAKGGGADAAMTQRLFGSAPYLAPEQAERQRVGKDPRTDVYQLGLILYEMLVLGRAFPGDALSDVLVRVREGFFEAPRKRNPAVPRELEAICMRALERSPERRYRDAAALRSDLDAYLTGSAVPEALRASRIRAFARGARLALRRRPILTAAVAAGVLSAGMFLSVPRANAATIDLEPYVLRKDGVSTLLADGASVAPGDLLGVIVPGDRPRHLYVLSLFENDADGRRCAPMRLLFEHEISAPAARAEFGLAVDACGSSEHCPRVLCTQVEAHNRVEGLLIFSARERNEGLETWMSSLATAARWREPDPASRPPAGAGLIAAVETTNGVDLDKALQRLFETTRGSGASTFETTREQRDTALRALSAPRAWKAVRDLVPGVDCYKIECAVAEAR